ncbi:hypothetical protein UNSWDHB_700 [Dehalobacter sp. UNSWDHB]|jgi:Predicted metal-binding protein|nr:MULTISPECIES: DUF2284 domain-containing protein [unclassified Dehalobacter]AFV01645.1 hypothetical protein DHBDCA_p616 [Dehalobacter sp. DCA]AFV04681.1 hypothetical protein DCF50_p674 [Dehalobacter sp. CF]EQB21956.1 hypothetical protein UNSWDHB_700 [Dehalobacter sp. UNSWDHB]
MNTIDYNELKEKALEFGFSHVGNLDADTIVVREEVRSDCAKNKCKVYDKNWSCPPACGPLEECASDIKKYKNGLILQTTGQLEDSFDIEAMAETQELHNEHCNKFSEYIHKNFPDSLFLVAGACTRCKECTYPDKPCRFPDKMNSSMEAYGLVVSDVCAANNIPYYYGPNTITYVGCALIE